MTSLWMFPGQGSQRKGMGAQLFDRYPDLVAQADDVLGWSLRRLCLEDPESVIGQTRFTQPALFAVSALSFLARRDDGGALPEIYAGHSLGEFNALFAAGAFDFQTGIALVSRRGQLMSKAPEGAMAAVVGLGQAAVAETLMAADLQTIDIANINAADQIVISGLRGDIERSQQAFLAAGARFVRLQVSAAFHSRYMRDVQDEFAMFIGELSAQGLLRPLCADALSNRTARLHDRINYVDALVEQISQPVRWHESMCHLLDQGELNAEEIGPGDVLTGLLGRIRKARAAAAAMPGSPVATSLPSAPPSSRPRIVFMYSGQGSQYYGMGHELYQRDRVFRDAIDDCNAIYRDMTGRDMVREIYDESRRWQNMTDIMLSHPALYSLGYALTVAMVAAGVRPDAVLGYSLGEYVAATVAGVLGHEDAMRTVVKQAKMFRDCSVRGGMLSVLAPVDDVRAHPQLYRDLAVGSINFDGNFVVSGPDGALGALAKALDARAIPSVRLPVEYPFHSPMLASLALPHRSAFDDLSFASPRLPIYSCATAKRVSCPDAAHYWDVTSVAVDFRAAINAIVDEGPCCFVDLGPSGTLSGFIRHGFGSRHEHHAVMNQFGRNAQTMAEALEKLAA
jgi:malonyl CoA-acyl carrier protein transacylase